MLKLYDFFQHSSWDGVRAFLGEWFILDSEDYDDLKSSYNAIIQLKPSNNSCDIYIDISNFTVDTAISGEPAIGFEIIGRIGNEEYYNIEYCEWDYWLGFNVPDWIVDTMSENKITAACLIKMTEHGYEFDDITNAREEIYQELQETVDDLVHRSIMRLPPPEAEDMDCDGLSDIGDDF